MMEIGNHYLANITGIIVAGKNQQWMLKLVDKSNKILALSQNSSHNTFIIANGKRVALLKEAKPGRCHLHQVFPVNTNRNKLSKFTSLMQGGEKGSFYLQQNWGSCQKRAAPAIIKN